MASRTQLRLGQITGSFGDVQGGIIDTAAAQPSAGTIDALALSSGSLVGVFSELASSLKRIHGGDTFAGALSGEFLQGIKVADAAGILIGAGGDEFSITESSDDISIKALISDKDMIFNVNDGGADTEVFRLDGDVSALLMASGKQIQLAAAGNNISADANDITVNAVRNVAIAAANKLTIDAQGTDAGDGVQITLGSDDTNTIFKVVNNSGQDAFSINGGKNAAVAGALTVATDLTVTGDLIVNGSQTVLDTTSLVIEDAVIALASGSSATADVNSAVVFQRATANLGGGSDMMNGALMFLQGTGFKLGFTNNDAETGQGSLAIADDDLAPIFAGKLNIDGTANNLDVASSNLTATAAAKFIVDAVGDITLDADSGIVNLDDGGAGFAQIIHSAGTSAVVLSSSAGLALNLDANNGEVLFAKDATNVGAVNIASAGEFKIGHYDPASGHGVGALNLKSGAISHLSASIGLQIDAGGAGAALQLKEAFGANFVALKSPDSLSGDLTLTLPTADGSANHVMVTDGAGQLSFTTLAGLNAAKKGVKLLAAGIAAGDAVNFNAVTQGEVLSGFSGIKDGRVDVFVNGQLMTSGSLADFTAANVDFRANGDTVLNFSFDLEVDDTVTVISR